MTCIKVGLIGAQGTGKTTLARAILNRYIDADYDAGIVSEVARDCPYPLNEGATIESQNWIMSMQIQREIGLQINMSPSKDLLVCDRTTIDQLAYVYVGYDDGRIRAQDMLNYARIAMSWAGTYDGLIYLPIEIPLVNDGVRSTNPDFQRKIDEYIVKILSGNESLPSGFRPNRDIPVLELRGTVDQRLTRAENFIDYL